MFYNTLFGVCFIFNFEVIVILLEEYIFKGYQKWRRQLPKIIFTVSVRN